MNKILILSKVFLKNGSSELTRSKKKSMPQSLTMLLVMGILMMSIGIPFGTFVASSYDMLAPAGQAGMILGFGLSVVSIAIFVFGIFYVLTTFYFSKDIENLLPLPIKPYEILSAKFVTVLVYEYFTEIVFLLPTLIAYGVKSGGGILYYLYALIVFLTLPVVPLVLASAINMVIMRFTNLGKHKDALRIAGGLIAMIFGVGINIVVQRSSRAAIEDPQAMVRLLMEGQNSLVGISTKIFPSTKLAAWSLIEDASVKGLQNLLLFLIITAAFIGIFMVLAEMLYFRGVVGVSESYSKRKNIGATELDKNLIECSAIRTYTMKELRLLFRTPSYFINCVLMNFIWPVFLLIPVVSQPEILTDIRKVEQFINNPSVLGIVVAAGFAVGIFLGATTGITATAISREGQNIYVGKYLPMRYKEQIVAKVLSGILLNSIGVVIALVVAVGLTKPPSYAVVLVIVTALLGVAMMSFTGILIDLHFPKLDWDNEQKAVKQNFNLMINMFLGIILAVASVFFTVKLDLTLWQAFGGIVIAAGIIDLALYYVLSTYGETLYGRIEA